MDKQNLAVQINLAAFKHGIDGSIERKQYIEALKTELYSAADYAEDYVVDTLFITGTNPMQYPVDALTNIIDTLKANLQFQREAEITIYALPGSITYGDIHALHEHGVNRISFDMQTFIQSELDVLGRTYAHSAMEVFMRMVQLKMVFFNYDITLYYGIPGQNADTLLHSLDQAIKYMGMHITLLPYENADKSTKMELYQTALQAFKLTSYEQYTPRHFCRHGFSSWWSKLTYSMKPLLGFGVNAESRIDGMITRNVANISSYINAAGNPEKIITGIEPITQTRLEAGTILNDLFNLKTSELTSLDPEVTKRVQLLAQRNLITINNDRISLTDTGMSDWEQIASGLTF